MAKDEGSQEKDVQNVKELMQISFRIATAVKKISRNGLEASDLLILVDEAKKMDLYVEGFSDLDKLDEEIKDLSSEEAVELVKAGIEGVKKFKEA